MAQKEKIFLCFLAGLDLALRVRHLEQGTSDLEEDLMPGWPYRRMERVSTLPPSGDGGFVHAVSVSA